MKLKTAHLSDCMYLTNTNQYIFQAHTFYLPHDILMQINVCRETQFNVGTPTFSCGYFAEGGRERGKLALYSGLNVNTVISRHVCVNID